MAESLGMEAWIEIIGSWKKSGLGQSEFCRKNKLKTSAFFYWRRRIEASRAKSKTKESKRNAAKASGGSAPDFIEIPFSDASTVKESNGRVLRFTTSYGATIEIPL